MDIVTLVGCAFESKKRKTRKGFKRDDHPRFDAGLRTSSRRDPGFDTKLDGAVERKWLYRAHDPIVVISWALRFHLNRGAFAVGQDHSEMSAHRSRGHWLVEPNHNLRYTGGSPVAKPCVGDRRTLGDKAPRERLEHHRAIQGDEPGLDGHSILGRRRHRMVFVELTGQ